MKKVIIIGAGIAGLSTGCYAQNNGYESEIYEMHNIPGGLCTSWQRKGYVFDGCIHWLMGAQPKSPFYKYWGEIGALKENQFLYHDLNMRLEDSSGRSVELRSDVEEMQKQLLETAPEDEALIRELMAGVRSMMKVTMDMDKPQDMYHALDLAKLLVKMGPSMNVLQKLNSLSIGQYIGRFKNSFLREALPGLMSPDYTMMVYCMVLATYASGDAAWPMGGSLAFARSIEKSYLNRGGKIHYGKRVAEILVEKDAAVGIRLTDGTEVRSDFVISAADGHTTIYKMLGGKYTDDRIDRLYNGMPLAPTTVQVSLGVDCDLSDQPEVVGLLLDKPYRVGGIDNNVLVLRHYCYDPATAPKGKSVITTILCTPYEYWEKLYQTDRNEYNAQKTQIGQDIVRFFEERFPQAKGKVEVVDVSTPYTYTRYTGTWKGVYMSWLNTTENSRMTVPGKLPGLSRFYLAGQWAHSSGGVPVGLITGRWALMRLCREDHRRFSGKMQEQG